MAHTTLQSWTAQFSNYTTPPFTLYPIFHTHDYPFQSCTYLTTMTLQLTTLLIMMMTLNKTTMRLNQEWSRFQPLRRCKVSCTAVYRQHSCTGELVIPK